MTEKEIQGVLDRIVERITERFRPEKIILFGSYATGRPRPDSDVDLLVVMPARNEVEQAIRILNVIDRSFPLDLLVRTPQNLKWRIAEGDWFLREVVGTGKVLYEKTHERVGAQGRRRSPGRSRVIRRRAASA